MKNKRKSKTLSIKDLSSEFYGSERIRTLFWYRKSRKVKYFLLLPSTQA